MPDQPKPFDPTTVTPNERLAHLRQRQAEREAGAPYRVDASLAPFLFDWIA